MKPAPPFTVGLTGGIASGKSTVSGYFRELGITVVDADRIAAQVVAPKSDALASILAHFGADMLDDKQQLNRRALRARIFNHDEERRWLEALLHPRIRDAMQEAILACRAPYCIADIPLLAENYPHPLIQRVLVVDIEPALQLERLQAREGINTAQAKAMIKTQASRERRLAIADDVIDNNQDEVKLKQQVKVLHEKYKDFKGRIHTSGR